MRRLYAVSFGIILALASTFECSHAAEPVARFYAGANGCWFDNEASPGDFEIGGSGRTSLSPHISLVGGAWYGLGESYLRGTLGGRVTVSDVSNPNFSIGTGIFYQASSKVSVRPQEWAGEVSLGWRPYPATMPRVVLVGQGSYGFDSDQASALVGVRYSLGYEQETGGQP